MYECAGFGKPITTQANLGTPVFVFYYALVSRECRSEYIVFVSIVPATLWCLSST
jgi:hypothetical protein